MKTNKTSTGTEPSRSQGLIVTSAISLASKAPASFNKKCSIVDRIVFSFIRWYTRNTDLMLVYGVEEIKDWAAATGIESLFSMEDIYFAAGCSECRKDWRFSP